MMEIMVQRRARCLHRIGTHLLLLSLLFHIAGGTHQSSPRKSPSSVVTRQHHHHNPPRTSNCCCFSTSPSFLSLTRSSPKKTAVQPITATSLFFQRRWKTKRSFFLLPDVRSSLQYYEQPRISSSSYNSHYGGVLSRQIMRRRGGCVTTATTEMSAVVTTEESSSSASILEEEGEEEACNNNDRDEDEAKEKQNKLVMIHSYNCTTMLVGLGIPKRQFATWVQYYLSSSIHSDTTKSSSSTVAAAPEIEEIMSNTTTQQVHWENDWEDHITSLRQHWTDGRLLCEHTHLLNDRGGRNRIKNKKKKEMEEQDGTETRSGSVNGSDSKGELDDEEEQQMKYEQFRNVLGSYADRLVNIVEDELSDVTFFPHNDTIIATKEASDVSELLSPRWNTRLGLRGWIENEYGVEKTRALMADEVLVKSEKEQLEIFQNFLDWFRGKFPYFHDACDACGASCKDAPLLDDCDNEKGDDPVKGEIIGSNNVQEEADLEIESCQTENDEENDDEDSFSFVGYIGPSPGERLGNASRTELYRCRSCSAFTRFPRYNKALWVTQTRRGRCGEYSMLLYRMLRSLGYKKIRWVVDWADHVWVEVMLGDGVDVMSDSTEENAIGRWVHLDPCEAAVDNPLLYSSWGKNQTYLIAFYDPHTMIASTSDGKDSSILPVEDVTLRYTNDDIEVVTERRGISEESVAEAIKEVSCKMASTLKSVCS